MNFSPFTAFSESPQAAEAHGQLAERHAIIDKLAANGIDKDTINDGCSTDFLSHVASAFDDPERADFAEDDDAELSDEDLGDIDKALQDHGLTEQELADMPLEDKVEKLIGLLKDEPAEFAEDTDGCDDQEAGGGDPDHLGGGHHDPAVKQMLSGYGVSDREVNRLSEDDRCDQLMQLLQSDDGKPNHVAFCEVTDPELRQVGRHFDTFSERYAEFHKSRNQVLAAYIFARRRTPNLTAREFLSGN